jgi:Capsule assembly protein Wzi
LIVGGAARTTFGPFFAYADQEFQHAPSQPDYSTAIQAVVLTMDGGLVYAARPTAQVNQLKSLDTYAGVNFKNWQISFGRQSLWWGTSEGGPMLLSNNAEPINMLRISRVEPFRLPSFLGVFGPMRLDFMVGQLGGHMNPGSTWMQQTRVSFKMTENFEFGISHEALFGGLGHPSGIGTFFKAFLPFAKIEGNGSADQNLYDQAISYDFLYRFKRYITFYDEMVADDAPTPLLNIGETSMNAGVYFARLPWISEQFDLRLEGVYTASPLNTAVYYNNGFLHYYSTLWGGLFNDGNIIGNSIGRDGYRYQGWLTYTLSPKSSVQLNIRHTQISPDFVPGGAHWMDYAVKYVQDTHSGFYFSSSVQVERLHYPVLFASPRTNVTSSVEFGYTFGESRR